MLQNRGSEYIMHQRPLIVYVIAVIITWALVLCAVRFAGGSARYVGGGPRFTTFLVLCAGFFLGMIAMFIATRVYK